MTNSSGTEKHSVTGWMAIREDAARGMLWDVLPILVEGLNRPLIVLMKTPRCDQVPCNARPSVMCVVQRGWLAGSPGLALGLLMEPMRCFGVKDQRVGENAHLKSARIINTLVPDFA